MAGLLSADPVTETLRRWAAEPFVWGASDCGLSILDHVERATGRRLADPPRYGSRRRAIRLLRVSGGYEALGRRLMAELGFGVTAEAVRSDVGLVRLPVVGLTACLCLGPLWAARGAREVLIGPMAPIVAWRIAEAQPCRRP